MSIKAIESWWNEFSILHSQPIANNEEERIKVNQLALNILTAPTSTFTLKTLTCISSKPERYSILNADLLEKILNEWMDQYKMGNIEEFEAFAPLLSLCSTVCKIETVGESPFHKSLNDLAIYSACRGDTEFLRRLLRLFPFLIRAQDNQQRSLAMCLSDMDEPGAVQLTYDHPSLTKIKMQDGSSLLHYALSMRRFSLAEVVCSLNPQLIELTNNNGLFPIETLVGEPRADVCRGMDLELVLEFAPQKYLGGNKWLKFMAWLDDPGYLLMNLPPDLPFSALLDRQVPEGETNEKSCTLLRYIASTCPNLLLHVLQQGYPLDWQEVLLGAEKDRIESILPFLPPINLFFSTRIDLLSKVIWKQPASVRFFKRNGIDLSLLAAALMQLPDPQQALEQAHRQFSREQMVDLLNLQIEGKTLYGTILDSLKSTDLGAPHSDGGGLLYLLNHHFTNFLYEQNGQVNPTYWELLMKANMRLYSVYLLDLKHTRVEIHPERSLALLQITLRKWLISGYRSRTLRQVVEVLPSSKQLETGKQKLFEIIEKKSLSFSFNRQAVAEWLIEQVGASAFFSFYPLEELIELSHNGEWDYLQVLMELAKPYPEFFSCFIKGKTAEGFSFFGACCEYGNQVFAQKLIDLGWSDDDFWRAYSERLLNSIATNFSDKALACALITRAFKNMTQEEMVERDCSFLLFPPFHTLLPSDCILTFQDLQNSIKVVNVHSIFLKKHPVLLQNGHLEGLESSEACVQWVVSLYRGSPLVREGTFATLIQLERQYKDPQLRSLLLGWAERHPRKQQLLKLFEQ